uniref:Uncharacterized protein n=1 Tax=Digenea simplex TaxID=945030 RepID=A0A1Z1MUH0_DIGSM|nr:hypothetical protein [Digenea simplex]ARW69462.1 hypothetical protein [Digenea simplex]
MLNYNNFVCITIIYIFNYFFIYLFYYYFFLLLSY